MLRNLSAMKLQQWGRALMVRRAFYHLFVLEDKVLLRPKPAHLAMKFLLPEEQESRPSSSSNSATASASEKVGKLNRPDQGLGSKDPRLGSKDPKMGSKDGRLASKAGREDFADFVRGSLTCQVPMQPMVTLAALAHHFQQSGWYAPSNSPEIDPTMKAAKAIFKLLHVPYDGGLQEGHLEQIYRHHRMQWRIRISSTTLRMAKALGLLLEVRMQTHHRCRQWQRMPELCDQRDGPRSPGPLGHYDSVKTGSHSFC
eukprot:symbB.v1.2.023805.t1/scaffold2161.1/size87477/3